MAVAFGNAGATTVAGLTAFVGSALAVGSAVVVGSALAVGLTVVIGSAVAVGPIAVLPTTRSEGDASTTPVISASRATIGIAHVTRRRTLQTRALVSVTIASVILGQRFTKPSHVCLP